MPGRSCHGLTMTPVPGRSQYGVDKPIVYGVLYTFLVPVLLQISGQERPSFPPFIFFPLKILVSSRKVFFLSLGPNDYLPVK
jgi:hypothetical protein